MKTAYELGKEYNEWGWTNVILPRIERMLEMTEHVHEWRFDIRNIPGIIECAFVCECGEEILGIDVLRRLNATERLSADDARTAEKDLAVAFQVNNLLSDLDIITRLRAYADTLEGK